MGPKYVLYSAIFGMVSGRFRVCLMWVEEVGVSPARRSRVLIRAPLKGSFLKRA